MPKINVKNSVFHIADKPQNYRPLTNNNFQLTVFGLDGMRNWALEDPEAKLTDSDLTLKIGNKSFGGPKFSQQSLSITRGNLTIEFPGRIDAFQTTAVFQVFMNKSAWDILYSWKMASGNHETGDVGDPDDYWKTVEIDVTTGNKGTLVGTWVLNNCWLSELQEVTFDHESNEVKSVNITLKFFKPKWRTAGNK